MTTYTLATDFLCAKAGQEVVKYLGPTYGVVADDDERLGEPCMAVSAEPDGGTPFIVIPVSMLVKNSCRRCRFLSYNLLTPQKIPSEAPSHTTSRRNRQ